MSKVSLITEMSSEGPVEASRGDYSDPWEIGYPWKDERFYGTPGEVKKHMKKSIKEWENENND